MSGERTLLVDGHALAFRAYYALPELNAPDGTPTNAVLGFLNMLLKVINDEKPDRVVIFFDAKGETFRHKAYEEYKEGRPPAPEEFKAQIPILKELMKHFGYPVVEIEGVEADDAIASCVRSLKDKGEILVLTADKDMLQLVRANAKVLRPIKGVSTFKIYDEKTFEEEFGFPPSSFPDYLALIGDKADNIPGIPGIGPKRASALIQKYGSLENIYEHLDELPPRITSNLKEKKEELFQWRELIRLRDTLEIDPKVFEQNGHRDDKALVDIFEKLGFRQIPERLGLKVQDERIKKTPDIVDRSETTSQLTEAHDDENKTVSLSFEAEGRYPQSFKMTKCAVAKKDGSVYVIDTRESEDYDKLMEKIKGQRLLLWGFKELTTALKRSPCAPDDVWDGKIAYYLLHPDMSTSKEGLKKIKEARNSEAGLEEEALSLFDICKKLSAQMDHELLELMYRIDVPLSLVLSKMEMHGIRMDLDLLWKIKEKLERTLEDVNASIDMAAGSKVNLNSPKQVGWLLFEHLGLPVIKRTKTGYSTDVTVLEELSRLDRPEALVAKLLLDHRELSKMLTGFVQPLIDAIDPKTGKVHTTFEHTSTGTGRLSSRDPNLQNLPAYGDWAIRLKEAFIPSRQGGKFIGADYSQIELRVLAHISGDEKLREAFERGRDIHAETAAWVFGIDSESVSPELRRMAKMINFGLLYGMTPYGLASRLGIGREEAKAIIERYFSGFPKVREYIEKSYEEAKKRGYTLSLFGRRRPLSEVTTVEGNNTAALKRVAINTPIQSTAADITKLAMIRFDEALQTEHIDANLVLQVHDSLICECYSKDEALVSELLKRNMEEVVKLSVPLEVDIKSGYTLAEV